jgi:hypothetical protein
MIKVIIAGGRDFDQYQLLKLKCNVILKEIKQGNEIQIVSGSYTGADKLGERYAREHHYICKRFEADWDKEGLAAGPIRNERMAKYSDYLIAFWNGKSKGTKNMIDLANRYNLKVRIIKYA